LFFVDPAGPDSKARMFSRRIAAVALAAFAVAPATALAARTAYVAEDAQTAQLVVGLGGALSPLGVPALAADSPRRLTMTPDGKSLYVTAGSYGNGRVLQYDVEPNGAATPKPVAWLEAGKKPAAIAITPDGQTLYVADRGSDHLRQFHVGAGGGLESLETLPLAGPPVGLTVAPDGKRVYMTVAGFIKRMDIGPGGGLDAATLVGHNTGGLLTDVVLTPDGRHLYAARHDGILGFEVAPNGSITPFDPPVSAAGAKVTSLAVSADSRSLYAAADAAMGGGLLQYTIEDHGALVAKSIPSQPLTGTPDDLAITPDGRSLYVAAGDLELFDLDATGLATPKAPPTVALANATGVVVSPNQAPVARFDVTVAPAGSAVVFDAGGASDPDGSITRYDWDFGDGSTLANGGPQVAHVYAQPGTYEARLVVTDNEGASTLTIFTGNSVLGNGSPAAATTRVVQVAAPVLPGPPPPVPAQPARPELGETVIVEPAGGRVRVRLPGEEDFVNLRSLRTIPVGSLVDARSGKARLSSVRDRSGSVQQGHFSQGLFQVRQRRSARFLTELILRGEIGPCPQGGDATASARRTRRLWGNGNGRFRTRGRYSSGAVRGTRWLVADTCEGTLTVVRRGRVAVQDFTRDLTTVLEKGERYLARPR
jgi:6-phosphogluconolactonase (cycloisomerase 2 family)